MQYGPESTRGNAVRPSASVRKFVMAIVVGGCSSGFLTLLQLDVTWLARCIDFVGNLVSRGARSKELRTRYFEDSSACPHMDDDGPYQSSTSAAGTSQWGRNQLRRSLPGNRSEPVSCRLASVTAACHDEPASGWRVWSAHVLFSSLLQRYSSQWRVGKGEALRGRRQDRCSRPRTRVWAPSADTKEHITYRHPGAKTASIAAIPNIISSLEGKGPDQENMERLIDVEEDEGIADL